MSKFYQVTQGTEEWDLLRAGKATASNFGTFMAHEGGKFGDPATKYALSLAIERITGKKVKSGFSNEHMMRGVEQEPEARAIYEQEYFLEVMPGGFFDSLNGYGCSPDGLVGDDGLIEIKSVIPSTHYNTMKRNSHPPEYLWQMLGNMEITGRDWVDFISYCSDFPENKRIIVYRVMRKDYESHIERLRVRRNEFLKLIDNIVAELQEERLTA